MEQLISLVPLLMCIISIICRKMNDENDKKLQKVLDDMERAALSQANCTSDNTVEVDDYHVLTDDEIWHMVHDPIELKLYPLYKPYTPKVQINQEEPTVQPLQSTTIPSRNLWLQSNPTYYNNTATTANSYNKIMYSTDGITWVARGGFGNKILIAL